MAVRVPIHYDPTQRPYQVEFLEKIRQVRIAVLVWSRRAGKDLTCFAYAVERMVEQPMNVVLVFPTLKQGHQAFWTNTENDGFRTLDHIPKWMIKSQTNSEDNMKIELWNGSVFRLLGADNAEALRGANAKLYILSEFVDINPEVLGVIRPVVALNGGQIIIQSTPKQDGISGGTFKRLYDAAKEDPTQLAMYIQGSEFMTPEQMEQLRQDYIAEHGNDFKYRQEVLLDWGQASSKSYYGEKLSAMKLDGRIGNHPYDPIYPVYTAWDLGMSDSTAVLFWQYIDGKLRIIDAYETHEISDEAVIRYVQAKPYNYGWHFLPHDGAKRDSDAITRIQKIRNMGLTNASLLRRTGREDGINRASLLLLDPNTTFHEPTTGWAIDKLKKYSRKYHPETGDYMGHDHKTESHVADTLRYTAEAIDQNFDPITHRFYYADAGKKQTVKTEELVSSNIWGDDDYSAVIFDF